MKRMYKTAVLLLCLSLLLPACSPAATPDTPRETTASAAAAGSLGTDTEPTVEETTAPLDNLPPELDLDGERIDVFIGDYAGGFISDMYAEETTGTRLNEAIHAMIGAVEDRLNADLAYRWETYSWAALGTFEEGVLSLIRARDDSIDLFFDTSNFTSQMLEGEYFSNLAATRYIDIARPYYNQTIIQNMPSDYIHFLSGDFAIANTKYAFAMFYNADMYRDLGHTESLYEIVKSGHWTLDKLEEMIADAYSDVNGDGNIDPYDQFGLSFGDTNKYLCFNTALDMHIITKENGTYSFTYGNEHAVDVVDRMIRLVNENPNVLKGQANNDSFPDWQISAGGSYVSRAFVEGRALFTCSLIGDAATIVPMIDFDYGLLPYPKWNDEQKNYQMMLQRGCYAMIPVSATSVDSASAALEALSSESYRSLIPEYVDVLLKTRYAADSDASEMVDMIVHSLFYDPGEIYSTYFGGPGGWLRYAINVKLNWTSHIASKRQAMETKLAQLLAAFQ